jgi:hypothetical protein
VHGILHQILKIKGVRVILNELSSYLLIRT